VSKSRWLTGGVIAIAAGVLAAQAYRRYREATRDIWKRLPRNSRVVATTRGPMEYALVGEGPTLLFAHGALGGYDQSLNMARLIHGFKVLAPSRPGYLRTPLTTGRSPSEQADAYAALLDALNISRVAIIGGSGGGPSALRFALQHPGRCWALVLVSAVCLRPPPSTVGAYWCWATLAPFDVAMWWFTHLAFQALMSGDGIAPEVRARLEHDQDTMDIVRQALLIHPTSLRTAGLVNDLLQAPRVFPLEGLERIRLPTLVIHGTHDPVVPFANAEHLARTIPGATLLPLEGGGHLSIATHREIAIPALETFLNHHAPKS
jgi:pimeloyl-ACP methyl ester carboxylesterase